MKLKQGLRQFTFFLALCGAVFCGCFCVLTAASEHATAQYRVDTHKGELQGWEACRQTKPALFRENEAVVGRCARELAEAEGSFWANLSPRKVVGVYVLAALGGAVGGYLAVWVVGTCIGLAIYGFIGLFARASRRADPLKAAASPADVPAGADEELAEKDTPRRSRIAVHQPVECH